MPKKHSLFLADEASVITGIQLSDRISVPSSRTMTDAGQMHVPCAFARTGTQLYTAKQLGLVDVEPNTLITVYRDEADVFDEESVKSFRSAPVTLGHPKDKEGNPISLTVDNAKELQVGMLEGMPVRDEDTLGGVLILTVSEAIEALDEGTQELSAGYTCDIELSDGKYHQRNIRANHIAIVAKGRAGSSCRISDEAEVHLGDAMLALQDALDANKAELEKANAAVEAGKEFLASATKLADEHEVALEKAKLELADAIEAAKEDVVDRCFAIEQARLISDMRIEDIGGKTTIEIKKAVVADQYPDKDLTGKKDPFIEAMFEIITDGIKGKTPRKLILL